MARLIEKENVAEYGGWVLWLETKMDCGFVQVLSFSYRCNADGSEDVNSVELVGFDDHDEYDMEEYGITWRLWDVYVETPSVQKMRMEPWEVY